LPPDSIVDIEIHSGGKEDRYAVPPAEAAEVLIREVKGYSTQYSAQNQGDHVDHVFIVR